MSEMKGKDREGGETRSKIRMELDFSSVGVDI
jgi:hypothetical protein